MNKAMYNAVIIIMAISILLLIGTLLDKPTSDCDEVVYIPELPVVDVLEKQKYTERELACMTLNLYFEARQDINEKEWLAISFVVMNRVKSSRWHDDVCDVISQPSQFSWYNPEARDKLRNMKPKDREAFERAYRFTVQFLTDYYNDSIEDITGGADHYHAVTVNPTWNSNMAFSGVYGKHIFWNDMSYTTTDRIAMSD